MKQFHLKLLIAIGVSVIMMNPIAEASVSSHLVRKTTELIGKQFSREAADMGTRALSQHVSRIASKYGDEGLRALQKCGPRAVKLIDDAGPQGASAVRLLSRYGDDMLRVVAHPSQLKLAQSLGDDAARILARHGAVAEPLLKAHGRVGVQALSKLSSRNVRRMAMLEGDGVLKQIPKCDSVLATVAKYGDSGCNWLWHNKGTLCLAGTGAVATAAFLADPEPFINGTKDLAAIFAESIAEPLALAAAAQIPWGMLALSIPIILMVLLGPSILALLKWWYRKRQSSDS